MTIAANGIEEEDGGGKSTDNPQVVRYEHRAIENNVVGRDVGRCSIEALNGVEIVQPFLAGPDNDFTTIANASNGGADQLVLSFQGEVYSFDAVSPDKVQAVLLLLGGYEAPSAVPAALGSRNNSGTGELPGRLDQPQRAASLSRFREKRKERCFDKKIRYNVRHEVALSMQRKKGRFSSSKTSSEETGSASSDSNAAQGSGQDDSTVETFCTLCGTSLRSTTMMRRGPAGPRSLCNACGLKWAKQVSKS